MGQQENLRVVERLWKAFDALDFETAGDLLHDDFIEEWPQSGEKVRGRENFVALNKHYPGHWRVTILNMLASGDQVVSEVKLEYKDEIVYAVSFFEFNDGKISRERDYWPEPFESPEWRRQWVVE